MSENKPQHRDAAVDDLYAEAEHWHVNTGGETIHAKRMTGQWRTIKWLANATWILFFFGPYLRWGDRQAVLFDIPHRQFHLLGVTVLPQDFWMLALALLFFAILLAVVTALAGRVWCGYFCFQTVWTDLYTWVEDKLEGTPPKRRKLDKAPWDFTKFRIKATKHIAWVVIGFLTGVSFVAWFTDVYQLWADLFTLKTGGTALITIGMFTGGTYFLAGWLREQTCFWLCPYARIQGVMVDATTILPTYDFARGEPRGRVRKGQKEEERTTGDCVDCNQCVAVCPTGVDIRHGQQEGCITCALCIDACDSVMEKLDRPKGLIRYASLEEVEGKETNALYKRPRVWLYSAILTAAVVGIGIGFSSLDAVEVKVLHERAPLFVRQSDGSIQNKYYLKILNKMTEDLPVRITASGPKNLILVGAEEPINSKHGGVTPTSVFVKVPYKDVTEETVPITFHVEATGKDGQVYQSSRESIFIGPERR